MLRVRPQKRPAPFSPLKPQQKPVLGPVVLGVVGQESRREQLPDLLPGRDHLVQLQRREPLTTASHHAHLGEKLNPVHQSRFGQAPLARPPGGVGRSAEQVRVFVESRGKRVVETLPEGLEGDGEGRYGDGAQGGREVEDGARVDGAHDVALEARVVLERRDCFRRRQLLRTGHDQHVVPAEIADAARHCTGQSSENGRVANVSWWSGPGKAQRWSKYFSLS